MNSQETLKLKVKELWQALICYNHHLAWSTIVQPTKFQNIIAMMFMKWVAFWILTNFQTLLSFPSSLSYVITILQFQSCLHFSRPLANWTIKNEEGTWETACLMHGLISCHWGYLRFLRMLPAQTHSQWQEWSTTWHSPEVKHSTLSSRALSLNKVNAHPLSWSGRLNRTEKIGPRVDTWKLSLKHATLGMIGLKNMLPSFYRSSISGWPWVFYHYSKRSREFYLWGMDASNHCWHSNVLQIKLFFSKRMIYTEYDDQK